MVQVVGALASAVRVGDLTILLPVHELISAPHQMAQLNDLTKMNTITVWIVVCPLPSSISLTSDLTFAPSSGLVEAH